MLTANPGPKESWAAEVNREHLHSSVPGTKLLKRECTMMSIVPHTVRIQGALLVLLV